MKTQKRAVDVPLLTAAIMVAFCKKDITDLEIQQLGEVLQAIRDRKGPKLYEMLRIVAPDIVLVQETVAALNFSLEPPKRSNTPQGGPDVNLVLKASTSQDLQALCTLSGMSSEDTICGLINFFKGEMGFLVESKLPMN